MLIIPLDQEFLALQVFGSVELRQFYSLKLSHLWSCQTLQDEKISYFRIRCRYNSIPLHNGFWRVWNLAKKFGKFLYKNLPIYKEKTWQKWSSVDPHCSLVTHSAKGRFKWKNWLFIMPFCHLLSILAAFLIANCDFWLKTTWLTFLKRFMTENWPKQKKSKKVSTRDRTGDLLCGSQNW